MLQKQILLLGAILVVLLGIAWLSGTFDRNPSSIRVPEINIPADEVTDISVLFPDSSELQLERQSMHWFVREPVDMLADSATVTRVLNDLGDLSLSNRITSNVEKFSMYGIDSTATTVTLTWPGGSERLVISRQGRDYSSSNIRIGESEDIYSTRARVSIPQDPERWRERKVLDIAPETVTSVRVFRQDASYTVSLNDSIWTVDGQSGDSLQIQNWLRRFAPLNADGFFDNLPVQALTDAPYRVEFSTSMNTTLQIQAMPAESDVALIPGGAQYTYRVFESRLEQLFPEPGSLQEE